MELTIDGRTLDVSTELGRLVAADAADEAGLTDVARTLRYLDDPIAIRAGRPVLMTSVNGVWWGRPGVGDVTPHGPVTSVYPCSVGGWHAYVRLPDGRTGKILPAGRGVDFRGEAPAGTHPAG